VVPAEAWAAWEEWVAWKTCSEEWAAVAVPEEEACLLVSHSCREAACQVDSLVEEAEAVEAQGQIPSLDSRVSAAASEKYWLV
jgi:hypothetical protein